MEVGVQRFRDFLAEHGTERLSGNSPHHFANQKPESDNVISRRGPSHDAVDCAFRQFGFAS